MHAHTSLLLAAALVLYPIAARAQSVDVPLVKVEKPVFTACQDGMRCVDAEQFRRVLEMRTQYLWLYDFYIVEYPRLVRTFEDERAARIKAYELLNARYELVLGEYEHVNARYTDLLSRQDDGSILDHPAELIAATVLGVAVGALATVAVVIAAD